MSTADPVATLLDVEVGDEVELAAEHYEWASAFMIVDVDEVRFINPERSWRARELVVRSAHPQGSDHDVTVVEGAGPPDMDPQYGRLVDVAILDDEEEDQNDQTDDAGSQRQWCGACGQGPFQEPDQVQDHHVRRDHAGEPSIRTADPRDDVAESPAPDATGGVPEDTALESEFDDLAPEWLDEASYYNAVELSEDLEDLADTLGWDDRDQLAALVKATGVDKDLPGREVVSEP